MRAYFSFAITLLSGATELIAVVSSGFWKGDVTDSEGLKWSKDLRYGEERDLLPEERERVMKLAKLPIDLAVEKIAGIVLNSTNEKFELVAGEALAAVPGWPDYFKAALARECQKCEISQAIRDLTNEMYSRPPNGRISDEEDLAIGKAQAEAQSARDRMGRYMELLIYVKKPEAVAIMAPYSFYPEHKWEPRAEVRNRLHVYYLAGYAVNCLRRWGIEYHELKDGEQKWWTENAHKYGADPHDIPWKQAQVAGETKSSPSPSLPPGNDRKLEKPPPPDVAGGAEHPEATPPPSPVLGPGGSQRGTRAFVTLGVAAIGILVIVWRVLKRSGRGHS